MDLKGKTVFLTGGARGLGKGFSEAMLEKGAKIFFCNTNETIGASTAQELANRFGAANVKYVPLDVTDKDKFADVFNQAVTAFGCIDIMVNNAGLMNESLADQTIAVNFTAVVHGTTLAVEHMRKDKGGRGGRIITISSVAGLDDVPHVPVYSATKNAVRVFTSALSKQCDREALGIEYGILCPNPAATDLILKADGTKVLYYDSLKDRIEAMTMPVSTVVDAFMVLLQLEKMNGAILSVEKNKLEYKKMVQLTIESPSTTCT